MTHPAENDRYGFLSSDGYPEEGPNPLIKPPPSAENDAAYDARAWNATLPCPSCGNMTVIGYLLVNEQGEHMHTRYACTFWPSGIRPGLPHQDTKRCGWEGWTVLSNSY